MRRTSLLVICLLVSVALNLFVLFFFFKNQDEVQAAEEFSDQQMQYPLLSKRILQEFPQDILINFLDLRKSLHEEVMPYRSDFGFYFEYLPTGTTIGVNEKDEFHAASLFKVPVVMAYYRMKERTKSTEDKTLVIKKEHIDKEFGELWKKGEGYKIKASDAVKLSLIESDNTAVKLLLNHITKQDFDAVYEALDVQLQADHMGALISAKNYSSILKALYFSSVLTKDSSEKILDILTKTKFPDKLAAGVPRDIEVAHKIGDFVDDEGKEGFRDCGIVYVPRRSYILCMFSVGDEQTARDRMQKVSKKVYDFIVSRKEILSTDNKPQNTSL